MKTLKEACIGIAKSLLRLSDTLNRVKTTKHSHNIDYKYHK